LRVQPMAMGSRNLKTHDKTQGKVKQGKLVEPYKKKETPLTITEDQRLSDFKNAGKTQ